MYQWLDRSHPQVLQSAVFLGYLMAFFCVLATGSSSFGLVFLVLGLSLAGGAFGTASNKKWGYALLAGASVLKAAIRALFLVLALLVWIRNPFSGSAIIGFLFALNSLVFPAALAAAVLHRHSREYQKIWFESGTIGRSQG